MITCTRLQLYSSDLRCLVQLLNQNVIIETSIEQPFRLIILNVLKGQTERLLQASFSFWAIVPCPVKLPISHNLFLSLAFVGCSRRSGSKANKPISYSTSATKSPQIYRAWTWLKKGYLNALIAWRFRHLRHHYWAFIHLVSLWHHSHNYETMFPRPALWASLPLPCTCIVIPLHPHLIQNS